MDYAHLKHLLMGHEGIRQFAYDDKTGNRARVEGSLTIGVGHNLENALPPKVIDLLLIIDMKISVSDCQEIFSNWFLIPDRKQVALASMAFNLGATRLGTFRKMLQAVEAYDWNMAAKEMLDSKWAKQVGSRSIELAALMRS